MMRLAEPRSLEEAMARKNIPQLRDLAARVGCAPRSLTGWLHGTHQPSAYYLGQLCRVFDTDVRPFLGTSSSPPALPRRTFMAGAATLVGAVSTLPLALGHAHPAHSAHASVPDSALASLAAITRHYRAMQRNGLAGIEDGLRGHIATIQGALKMTADDRKRRELWRVLAEAQLLARLNIMKESELGRAKTWNEAAIASARASEDEELVAALIGHLGHLYLMWQQDAVTAEELLTYAGEHTRRGSPLSGWLHLVMGATAARVGHRDRCRAAIDMAREVAHQTDGAAAEDPFYTDFNVVSVRAFAGNSLFTVGAVREGHDILTSINLGDMVFNRHASTYYDIARAFAADGELEAGKMYAMQAIDSAVDTNRLYMVPRLISWAREMHSGGRDHQHAREVMEYAYSARSTDKEVGT
jgi:hypothetical protein